MDIEQALDRRRTCRAFASRTLADDALQSVLWAAQGATSDGRRTTPSAGASYPLQLVVARGPDDTGTWTWEPATRTLRRRGGRDVRAALAEAAIGSQPWIASAPATLAFCADVRAMLDRFDDQPPGDRGRRYVDIEVGAAAQNAALQATALGLEGVMVGGFDDAAVGQIIGAGHLEPRLLFCFGHPA
jgi:SagB-type dehydrogenase family enzyme